MICEWSSIQLSSLSLNLSWERSFCRASAHWKDLILKLSSPRLRCWSIQVFICWLNDWACSMLWSDWNRCHEFHSSKYLRCLLYNPVALPYAFRPAWSTPTTCLWAYIVVGSGVHVRSGFLGLIVSSSVVSSGDCSRCTLSKVRLFIDWHIDGPSGAPTHGTQWWLWLIACRTM